MSAGEYQKLVDEYSGLIGQLQGKELKVPGISERMSQLQELQVQTKQVADSIKATCDVS